MYSKVIQILFHYRLLQGIEDSFLGSTAGPCWLSILSVVCVFGGFPGDSVVKNPPANAGDARDLGSIPGSKRFPGEENDNHPSILAWKTP